MRTKSIVTELTLIAGIALTVGCSKVTPQITSSFNTDTFISFQESQSVSDLNQVSLSGICKKEVSSIQILNSSSQWVEASTIAESGSDLDCSDGNFNLIVLSSNANLSSGKITPELFRMDLRAVLKSISSKSKRAQFSLKTNWLVRTTASEAAVAGKTGDGYTANVQVRDSVSGTTPQSETIRVYTNH